MEVQLACDLAAISDVRSGLRPAAKTATPTADGLCGTTRAGVWCGSPVHPTPADIEEGAGVVGWDFVSGAGPGDGVVCGRGTGRPRGAGGVRVAAGPETSGGFPVPRGRGQRPQARPIGRTGLADLGACGWRRRPTRA